MATIADLITLLQTAGFKVAAPGDNKTAPPCVVLSPVRLDLQPGNRLVYFVIDVEPTRPASPWETQYPKSVDDTVAVLRTLAGTQYQLTPTIEFATDLDGASPTMRHTINVRFAGPDLCPPSTQE